MFGHFRWLGGQYPTVIGAAFMFLLMGGIVNVIAVRGHGTFVGGSCKMSLSILLCQFGFLKLVPEVVDHIQ